VLRVWRGDAVLAQWETTAYTARFDPSGTRLVASDDRVAHVWSLDGKSIASLTGHEGTITDARWSPDGNFIATSSIDATIRIWDAHTGDELAKLTDGHSQWWTARFSPSGKYLVTTSSTGVVIWELPPTPPADVLRCRDVELRDNRPVVHIHPAGCT